VAGFFYGRGNHVWGINEAGYTLQGGQVAIGNELDFGNIGTNVTTLAANVTLPIVEGSSIEVASTAGYDISTGLGILTFGANFFSYTGANDTFFTGLSFLEGTNSGTLPIGTTVTYGVGGTAYGLVIVSEGGNIGGSPPGGAFIQLQANKASQSDTGVNFNGANRPVISKNGKLIKANNEFAVTGIDFSGSTFTTSAAVFPVNSGSTSSSHSLYLRTEGGFDNTGSALRIEGLNGTVLRGILFLGDVLPDTGTAIQMNSIPRGAYGMDMTNSTFSSASIRLDTLSTRGLWFGTDTVGTLATGLVWGTANDVALIHAAIGALRTTGSFRIQGYGCVGCSSAPLSTTAGDFTATRAFIGNNPQLATQRGAALELTHNLTAASGTASGIFTQSVFNPAPSTATTTVYALENYISTDPDATITYSGAMASIRSTLNWRSNGSSSSASLGLMGLFAVVSFTDPTSPAIALTVGAESTACGSSGSLSTAQITSARAFQANNPNLGSGPIVIQNNYGYYANSLTAGTALNVGVRIGTQSGAAANYGLLLDSNTASSGAGICAGIAGDVCIWRAAANTWTLNSGTSLQLDGGSIANVAISAIGGNLRLGSAVGTAKAVGDTTGWPLMPSVAGTPTGVPQNETANSAAFGWDRTNKKLCIRDQPTNTWKCSVLFTIDEELQKLKEFIQFLVRLMVGAFTLNGLVLLHLLGCFKFAARLRVASKELHVPYVYVKKAPPDVFEV
jgi:hypothetical protein